MTEQTKSCPYCAETILAEARKCKHCGEMLDAELRAERQTAPAAVVAAPSASPDRAMAIERLKANQPSIALLWVVNLIWPGLGNLVSGHVLAGLVIGTMNILAALLLVVGIGLGLWGFLWLVAGIVGHARINSDFQTALRALEREQAPAMPIEAPYQPPRDSFTKSGGRLP